MESLEVARWLLAGVGLRSGNNVTIDPENR